jgi:hypothetical protein
VTWKFTVDHRGGPGSESVELRLPGRAAGPLSQLSCSVTRSHVTPSRRGIKMMILVTGTRWLRVGLVTASDSGEPLPVTAESNIHIAFTVRIMIRRP